MESYGIPMEILWNFKGNPMGTYEFPWKSYRNPIEFLWKSYENPMKILWNSDISYGTMESYGFLWKSYGILN